MRMSGYCSVPVQFPDKNHQHCFVFGRAAAITYASPRGPPPALVAALSASRRLQVYRAICQAFLVLLNEEERKMNRTGSCSVLLPEKTDIFI
jgi:hypothetical protein